MLLNICYFDPWTRVTGHPQTIIENIFSNYISEEGEEEEAVFSNLACTRSDNLPQVLLILSMFLNNAAMKSNILERSWTNFNQAEFVMNYFDKDWSNILNPNHGNANESNLSKYINIYNYSIEFTPTESQASGTLLIINYPARIDKIFVFTNRVS